MTFKCQNSIFSFEVHKGHAVAHLSCRPASTYKSLFKEYGELIWELFEFHQFSLKLLYIFFKKEKTSQEK